MSISDAEWLVMNAVWDNQPVEAQTVVDLLASDNDWTAATIKTMLHRLEKKGVLTHDTEGKRFRYRAAVRRSDCVRKASQSFLNRVFAGNAAPALLHLVKVAHLSHEEIARLRALLDQKE